MAINYIIERGEDGGKNTATKSTKRDPFWDLL